MELPDLTSVVAVHYGLKIASVKNMRKRHLEIVRARSMAMYLATEIDGHGLSETARYFGCHHTTVLAARDRIADAALRYPTACSAISELSSALKKTKDEWRYAL